ncbi:MAG: amidohydrolase family protein [Planctomycetota bacterium]|nr:amidohydrolase family protein [Planctomycetota bacterium]
MVLLVALPTLPAQATDDADRVTVIRASRVITGTGEILEPGEVVFEDGKISLVGNQLEYPKNARIIDARGQTLMAGMILARSRHGLSNLSRNGIHCDWSPLRQLNDQEMPWAEFLEAGIVAASLVPAGSGFPGHAVVVNTAPESTDRILNESAFLPLNGRTSSGLYASIDKAFGGARGEIEKVEKAREQWDKEQEEAKKKAEEESGKKDGEAAEEKKKDGEAKDDKPKEFTPPEMNPSVVELVKILQEKDDALPIVFDASTPGLILHFDAAMADVKELKDRDPLGIFILPGTRNGAFHQVVEMLAERKATVLIPPGLSALPDTYTRISIPVALSRAGCTLVTIPRTDNPEGMRNIPGMLAELVRYGLSREAALASVTTEPARLLGLGDRMGTVEAGKEPHFVLFDADPLEPGARVMKTIIAGEVVWDREDNR